MYNTAASPGAAGLKLCAATLEQSWSYSEKALTLLNRQDL